MKVAKDILKAIFPRKLLKEAFLVFNKAKIATFDKVFFPPLEISKDDYVESLARNPFLELGVDVSGFSEETKSALSIWTNPQWTQDQYLFVHNQSGLIDPKTGWALTEKKELIYPSLGFSGAPHVKKPDFFDVYSSKRKITNLGSIVSLRDTGEENYFHFFNDVLPKIFYLLEKGIDLSEFTLVVGHRLYGKQYFRHYLEHPPLKEMKMHVQHGGEWIGYRKAIFCKPFTHTKLYLEKAVDIVAPRIVNSSRSLRIFLTRSEASLRFIENMNELEPLLRQYKFEVVDTSSIRFEEQVSMFGRCSHLIGVHGAGLTNMMFSIGYPVKVLEVVNPGPYIPFHYIMMARLFNFSYDIIRGSIGNRKGQGGFRVDVDEFSVKLKLMMEDHG